MTVGKIVKSAMSDRQKSLLAAYSQVLSKSGDVSDIPKFAKALLKNKANFDGLSLADSSNLLTLLQESEATVRDEVQESLETLGKILLEALLEVLKAKIGNLPKGK